MPVWNQRCRWRQPATPQCWPPQIVLLSMNSYQVTPTCLPSSAWSCSPSCCSGMLDASRRPSPEASRMASPDLGLRTSRTVSWETCFLSENVNFSVVLKQHKVTLTEGWWGWAAQLSGKLVFCLLSDMSQRILLGLNSSCRQDFCHCLENMCSKVKTF